MRSGNEKVDGNCKEREDYLLRGALTSLLLLVAAAAVAMPISFPRDSKVDCYERNFETWIKGFEFGPF